MAEKLLICNNGKLVMHNGKIVMTGEVVLSPTINGIPLSQWLEECETGEYRVEVVTRQLVEKEWEGPHSYTRGPFVELLDLENFDQIGEERTFTTYPYQVTGNIRGRYCKLNASYVCDQQHGSYNNGTEAPNDETRLAEYSSNTCTWVHSVEVVGFDENASVGKIEAAHSNTATIIPAVKYKATVLFPLSSLSAEAREYFGGYGLLRCDITATVPMVFNGTKNSPIADSDVGGQVWREIPYDSSRMSVAYRYSNNQMVLRIGTYLACNADGVVELTKREDGKSAAQDRTYEGYIEAFCLPVFLPSNALAARDEDGNLIRLPVVAGFKYGSYWHYMYHRMTGRITFSGLSFAKSTL